MGWEERPGEVTHSELHPWKDTTEAPSRARRGSKSAPLHVTYRYRTSEGEAREGTVVSYLLRDSATLSAWEDWEELHARFALSLPFVVYITSSHAPTVLAQLAEGAPPARARQRRQVRPVAWRILLGRHRRHHPFLILLGRPAFHSTEAGLPGSQAAGFPCISLDHFLFSTSHTLYTLTHT